MQPVSKSFALPELLPLLPTRGQGYAAYAARGSPGRARTFPWEFIYIIQGWGLRGGGERVCVGDCSAKI